MVARLRPRRTESQHHKVGAGRWRPEPLREHPSTRRGPQTAQVRSIDHHAQDRPNYNVQQVSPADFILFEEPFGRARFEISKLVDFSVHLDLPADIALARAVLRQKENGGDPIAFVERHLREGLSDFFRMQAEAGKESTDLVLDATLPERELTTTACKAIQNHFSET